MTTNRMGLEQESRLSDERLNEISRDYQDSEIDMMARELLAYREASKEPVAFSLRFRNFDGVLSKHINTNTTFSDREKAEKYGLGGRYITQEDGSLKWTRDTSQDPEIVPLYAAPPIQAVTVPHKATWRYAPVNSENVDWAAGWNACRAAMLNEPRIRNEAAGIDIDEIQYESLKIGD